MNLLRFGYRYSAGATSVDLPVKLTVASLSLVWYCVFLGHLFVVRLVPHLELVGFGFTPLELVGFIQSPSELVGSLVSPSESGYLSASVEYLVVVLHI